MAMTKAERAHVEELETALALHWPAYPMPVPMTREEIDAAKVDLQPESRLGRRRGAIGWFYNSYGKGSVNQGWSDGFFHSRNNITGDSASQDAGRMYRTRAEAWMACRIEKARECAKILAAIDRMIKGES